MIKNKKDDKKLMYIIKKLALLVLVTLLGLVTVPAYLPTGNVRAAQIEESIEELSATGVVVSKDALNMRKGPGTRYDIITSIKPGEELTVTGRAENGWYRVSLDGKEGFVSGNFLEVTLQAEEEIIEEIIGEPEEGYRGINISPAKRPLFIAGGVLLLIAIVMVITIIRIFRKGDDREDPEEDYLEDGYEDDGYGQEDYSDEEYLDEDYPEEDYPEDDYPEEGYPEEDYAEDDYSDEGYSDRGYTGEDYGTNGYLDDAGQYYQQESDVHEGYGHQGFWGADHKERKDSRAAKACSSYGDEGLYPDFRVDIDPRYFEDKEPIEQPAMVTGYLDRAGVEKGAPEEVRKARLDDAIRRLDELQEEIRELKKQ